MLFVTLKETQGLTAQSCSNQKLVTEQNWNYRECLWNRCQWLIMILLAMTVIPQISEVHSDAFFTEWYCSPGPETGKCATG